MVIIQFLSDISSKQIVIMAMNLMGFGMFMEEVRLLISMISNNNSINTTVLPVLQYFY